MSDNNNKRSDNPTTISFALYNIRYLQNEIIYTFVNTFASIMVCAKVE